MPIADFSTDMDPETQVSCVHEFGILRFLVKLLHRIYGAGVWSGRSRVWEQPNPVELFDQFQRFDAGSGSESRLIL